MNKLIEYFETLMLFVAIVVGCSAASVTILPFILIICLLLLIGWIALLVVSPIFALFSKRHSSYCFVKVGRIITPGAKDNKPEEKGKDND